MCKPIHVVFILLLLISTAIFASLSHCNETTGSEPELSEANARDIIEQVYLDVLQRYPDERGLYTYTKFLAQDGKSEEWLRNVLLNSEEGLQVAKRKQQRLYVLYALAVLPFFFIGIKELVKR